MTEIVGRDALEHTGTHGDGSAVLTQQNRPRVFRVFPSLIFAGRGE